MARNTTASAMMETIGSLIETYESQYIDEKEGDPIDALNALMEEHGLKQSDLSEKTGMLSEDRISHILGGHWTSI